MLVTPGAYPRRKHLKGAPIGLALALLSNSKTDGKGVSKDKHSGLLGLIVSNEVKSFITLTPGQLPRLEGDQALHEHAQRGGQEDQVSIS